MKKKKQQQNKNVGIWENRKLGISAQPPPQCQQVVWGWDAQQTYAYLTQEAQGEPNSVLLLTYGVKLTRKHLT